MRIQLGLTCISLAAAACTIDEPSVETSATPLEGGPIPIIYDSDMDFDDVAALAYLAQAHKQGIIDLRAVTVTNNGAGLPGFAIHHARCVLEAAGLGHIPVADNGLTVGPNLPSVVLRTGVQTILTATFPTCTSSMLSSTIPAPLLIASTVLAGNGSVHLLTSGPLTNVANALALDPLLPVRVPRLTSMAGVIYGEGELVGEWMFFYDGSQGLNEWTDAPAIDRVVRAFGTKLWLVPHDATQHVPITPAYAAELQATAATPEAQIVSSIANNPVVTTGGAAGLTAYWWDPLAALSAAGEPVVDYATLSIRVVLTGEQTGRTQPWPVLQGGTTINAGLSADGALFEDRFLVTLNGG